MRHETNQKAQFSIIYVAVGFILLALFQSWLPRPGAVEVPMSRFLQLVREEKMERVSLSEYTIKGILKPGVEPVRTTGAGDRLRQFIMGEEPSRLITVTRIPGVDDSALLRDLEAHSV